MKAFRRYIVVFLRMIFKERIYVILKYFRHVTSQKYRDQPSNRVHWRDLLLTKIRSVTSRDVSPRLRSRSLGQICSHDQKGYITRNSQMKYESTTSNGSKVFTKVKVFRNLCQSAWSRSQCNRSLFCL